MSANHTKGLKLNLTANFGGFNTNLYGHRGCKSTTCEGVEELKSLMVSQKKTRVRSSEPGSGFKGIAAQSEGVTPLLLQNSRNLGCSVLGPTCTYAAFQIVEYVFIF